MLVGIQNERRYLHFQLILACQLLGAASVSFSRADVLSGDALLDRCDFLCVRDMPPGEPGGLLILSQEVIDQVLRMPITVEGLAVLDHCPAPDTLVRLVKTLGSTGRPKIMGMTQATSDTLMEKSVRFDNDPGTAWTFINLYDFTLRSALRETEIALRFGLPAVSSTMETLMADMARFAEFRVTMVSGDAVRLADRIPDDWRCPRPGLISIKGGALPATTRSVLRSRLVSHVFFNYVTNETHRIAEIDDDGIGHPVRGI